MPSHSRALEQQWQVPHDLQSFQLRPLNELKNHGFDALLQGLLRDLHVGRGRGRSRGHWGIPGRAVMVPWRVRAHSLFHASAQSGTKESPPPPQTPQFLPFASSIYEKSLGPDEWQPGAWPQPRLRGAQGSRCPKICSSPCLYFLSMGRT